jgi:hypothetical protein
VYLRTTWWPAAGRTACWAALVGTGRPLLTVVEHDGPPLRTAGLDLRAEGLWSDQICETPLEHWTVGLEAFGVELDDPAEAFRGCRGNRAALGLDVEWESRAADLVPLPGGYELPCEVHGEVLIGAEQLVVDDGWGRRRHTWGTADPVGGGTAGRVWGRFDDGVPFAGWETVPVGADGMPGPLTFDVAGRAVEVRPHHPAPVALPDGRRLHRSLCRLEVAGGGGQAWVEVWEDPRGA